MDSMPLATSASVSKVMRMRAAMQRLEQIINGINAKYAVTCQQIEQLNIRFLRAERRFLSNGRQPRSSLRYNMRIELCVIDSLRHAYSAYVERLSSQMDAAQDRWRELRDVVAGFDLTSGFIQTSGIDITDASDEPRNNDSAYFTSGNDSDSSSVEYDVDDESDVSDVDDSDDAMDESDVAMDTSMEVDDSAMLWKIVDFPCRLMFEAKIGSDTVDCPFWLSTVKLHIKCSIYTTIILLVIAFIYYMTCSVCVRVHVCMYVFFVCLHVCVWLLWKSLSFHS